jgi:hypothetical protein
MTESSSKLCKHCLVLLYFKCYLKLNIVQVTAPAPLRIILTVVLNYLNILVLYFFPLFVSFFDKLLLM